MAKRLLEIEADGVEFDAQALWIALCGYGRFAQTKVTVREVLPEPPLSEEERQWLLGHLDVLADPPLERADADGLFDRRACRAKTKEGK